VEISTTVIKDSAGKVQTVAQILDITERKRLEEQLLQAQKMEAVGRLAGGVAHDFNNLLTAITGYSELLLMRIHEHDPLRKDLEQIRKAADRAASLTRQLLAFSRRQILQPRVLNLNAVVADMEEMLQRLIGEDIDLVTVLHPELGRVKADPGQIEQVIMNLVVNARDAMPQGGKLTIETANVVLDEDYVRRHVGVEAGSYVMLAVSDTGVGMDEDVQSHLFEPFFTTKETGKGTGLGLATTYGIIKQSNGHIWVYSEPGQGTTFKIYLPRVEESIEPVTPVLALTESLRGTEIILLVEDEDAVREPARRVLVQNGYTVLEARHGEEALRVCEQHEGTIHARGAGRTLTRDTVCIEYVLTLTRDTVCIEYVLEKAVNARQDDRMEVNDMALDLVCGTVVDEEEAAYISQYQGMTFYFGEVPARARRGDVRRSRGMSERREYNCRRRGS